MHTSRRRGHQRDEAGVAALEFALVVPVLLMVVFGIVAFGVGYNYQLQVTQAAREGARTLAVTGSTGSATAAAQAAAAGLDAGSMSIVLSGCPSTPGPTDTASASISYPYTYNIPGLGDKSVTLTADAVMHCGG